MQKNNRSHLVDIADVRIDQSLPTEERQRRFAETVGDPCRFRVGETPVTVAYDDRAPNLQKVLAALCQNLQ